MQKTAKELKENIALIERTLNNTPDKNSDMAKAMSRNLIKYKQALQDAEINEKKNIQQEQRDEQKPDESSVLDSLRKGFKSISDDAKNGKSLNEAIESGLKAAGLVGK
jgi:hypothetical protein